MSRLKYIQNISLKELSLERVYNSIKIRIMDIPHFISWHLNFPHARRNKNKISKFHNIHKGKRCFIVANGPSLNQTDLTLLKNEVTIGMNRIYLNADKMGFMPTYIVVQDITIQLKQFQEDYESLKLPKFFNWNGRHLFKEQDNLTFIRSDYTPKFYTDLTKSSWGGHSVTNTCIQLAFYMGFSEVYLVGKDHNYEQKGVPGQLVSATGNESNHFIKGYYHKGLKWRIPDYKGEELAYRLAKETYEYHNRVIKDATINGHLQIFEKIDYKTLF
jgi:hypothetical protein